MCTRLSRRPTTPSAPAAGPEEAPMSAPLCLHRVAQLIRERVDSLAPAAAPSTTASRSARRARWWRALPLAPSSISRVACETMEEAITPSRGDFTTMSVSSPWAWLRAITPWNPAHRQRGAEARPALAAGNAVVVKARRKYAAAGAGALPKSRRSRCSGGIVSVLLPGLADRRRHHQAPAGQARVSCHRRHIHWQAISPASRPTRCDARPAGAGRQVGLPWCWKTPTSTTPSTACSTASSARRVNRAPPGLAPVRENASLHGHFHGALTAVAAAARGRPGRRAHADGPLITAKHHLNPSRAMWHWARPKAPGCSRAASPEGAQFRVRLLLPHPTHHRRRDQRPDLPAGDSARARGHALR